MKRTTIVRALLAGTAMIISTGALAQEAEPQPDTSDATADAAIAAGAGPRRRPGQDRTAPGPGRGAPGIDRPDPGAQAKATPSWKGAPELADKDAGFSFKPKGFMQFDAGYVGYPDGDELRGTVGGSTTSNLGFNTRARRLVFGAEGSLPGRLQI